MITTKKLSKKVDEDRLLLVRTFYDRLSTKSLQKVLNFPSLYYKCCWKFRFDGLNFLDFRGILWWVFSYISLKNLLTSSNPLPDNHANSFTVFIIASETYMMLSYWLNKSNRKIDALTKIEMRSLRLKKYLFATNVISMALAVYSFLRHNQKCESGGKLI